MRINVCICVCFRLCACVSASVHIWYAYMHVYMYVCMYVSVIISDILVKKYNTILKESSNAYSKQFNTTAQSCKAWSILCC